MVALGVNISSGPSQAGADCALAKSLDAQWVRVSVEQSNGNAIADLTAIVKAAHDHGLLVLQTCQPIGHKQPRSQVEIDSYATHVAACSTIADATGRDNESNGYGSNETPDPKACAASMVACIETRNAHAKGRVLVTDELCPGDKPVGTPLGGGYVAPLAFFKAMVAAQPSMLHAPHLWVGWHGYEGFGYPANDPADWNTCYAQRTLDAYIVSVVGKHLPITSTEFGSPTGPPGFGQARTYAQQADDFDGYISEARAQHKAGVQHGPWIWYTLRDRATSDKNDWSAACGLVDVHGTPKPIAARFTAAASKGA
jgi:hypothetical protein